MNENITVQYDEGDSVCGWDKNQCKEKDENKEGSFHCLGENEIKFLLQGSEF